MAHSRELSRVSRTVPETGPGPIEQLLRIQRRDASSRPRRGRERHPRVRTPHHQFVDVDELVVLVSIRSPIVTLVSRIRTTPCRTTGTQSSMRILSRRSRPVSDSWVSRSGQPMEEP